MPSARPQELAGLPGVAAVVGNSHKAFAPANRPSTGAVREPSQQSAQYRPRRECRERAASATESASIVAVANRASLAPDQPLILADDRFAHSFLEEAQLVPGAQTRPNLKIQEGCGTVAPFASFRRRAAPRSLPAETILRRPGFVAAGGNELVLSGINLGRWGRDLELSGGNRPSAPLPRLVRAILEQTEPAPSAPQFHRAHGLGRRTHRPHGRIRGTRLARHAHLPLQSGSDAVLRRMHRRYRPWHYAEKVAALLRAAGPGLTLGADVMVGFPGETDREFRGDPGASFACFPLAICTSFRFRRGRARGPGRCTPNRPCPAAVVEERMAALRSLAAEKSECAPQALHRARTRRHHPSHAVALVSLERPHLRAH